jgi:hypothetical protein
MILGLICRLVGGLLLRVPPLEQAWKVAPKLEEGLIVPSYGVCVRGHSGSPTNIAKLKCFKTLICPAKISSSCIVLSLCQ